MLYSFAHLGESQLKAVQTIEKKLGKRVLALKEHAVQYALVTPEELEGIRKLEDELKMTLVVVE